MPLALHPEPLNPKQTLAVHAPPRPLLIVAGAGTGKTRTLTSRLLHLIEQGTPPAKICALTFTNKAAREMASRVASVSGAFIGTFHSLGAGILRREARRLGRTPNFVIFDDHDAFMVVKRAWKEMAADAQAGTPAFFAQRLSAIKNGTRALREFEHAPRLEDRLVPRLYRRYETALQNNNAFDFDDLIEKVVRLFTEHEMVLRAYRRRFQYLLVDEYQDLNNMQHALVKLLAAHSGHVSVVGDDGQMIYGWRGSNFEIFRNFERDWPNAQVVVLDQNYRSTRTILAAASELALQNRLQRPKYLWTENDAGSPIEISEAEDAEEEAEWIARRIGARRSEESTAVLYRTNAQSRAIEAALSRRGIPYRIFGGIRFYERKEIKDILAALRCASNEKDSVSRERLEKVFSGRTFRALSEALRVSRHAKPLELIRAFLEVTDYFSFLDRNFPNPEERKENIAEFMHLASGFTELTTFLEQIALLEPTDQRERVRDLQATGPGEVALMTMHLAKGLEFDLVFLAGCNEGLLPHSRSQASESELEEERRLLYVGMTRAKKTLAVSFYDVPSRFLSELPTEFLRLQTAASLGPDFLDSDEPSIALD